MWSPWGSRRITTTAPAWCSARSRTSTTSPTPPRASRCTWTTAPRPCPTSCICSWRPASAQGRSRCRGPASTTSSSPRRAGASKVARPRRPKQVPDERSREGDEAVNETVLLGRRAVREVWRIPAATIPALFIPVFFLVVNLGQVNKIFPPSTPFLHGQHYVAFQIPVSLVFAVSSATSGLAMVTDIDIGYLDKLLAAPIRRTAIVWGRLAADLARGIAVSVIVLAVGYAFGARVKSGAVGTILLIVLAALWGVAYAGIAIAIALKTKNVQTTNASFLIFFPLLFLTPNFVPMDLLAGPLKAIARVNPVTYVITGLRDLVLFHDIHWGSLGACVLTIFATGVVLTWLSMRALATFAD